MISAELIAKICRLFFAEHWKIVTIASELDLHHDTVRAAIESHRFNLHQVSSPRASLTDPYLDFIEQTLKQYPRLRATRFYEMLRARGYTGSVVQLRRVVRSLRRQKQEAFLRLTTLADRTGAGRLGAPRASPRRPGHAQALLLRHHALLLARAVGRILL